ncbi:MAG: hypothetical protein RSF40_01835 [Oscillospiraceae bacterium]
MLKTKDTSSVPPVVAQEDFIISIERDELGNEATIVTSTEDQIAAYEDKILLSAIKDFDVTKRQYSAYYSDKSSNDELTPELIDELANGIQTSLAKVQQANGLVRRYIITNDIIGKTYEAIETNVNTNTRLSFGDYSQQRNKNKKLSDAKLAVNMFNKQINLKRLIRDAIPITYAEGTNILYLRYDGNGYVVDKYPLGVAIIEQWEVNGKPVVSIDIKELETRLKKTYEKDKKNKARFFNNIEEDIKANYPEEVYKAYKNKENRVELNNKYTGVMRIGNMGRNYGVSPIVRALKAALLLENFESTDFITAKSKAKKIIHQVMRKECLGEKFDKKGLEWSTLAHNDLIAAWKNKTVLYTSIPQVEKLLYVESKVEDTSADKINLNRSKIMTTLGIGFADTNVANFSVANISLDQLLKTINSISQQLEYILEDWYKVLFENEGLDFEYLPEIQILDCEQMSLDMKKDLVELLYSKLNCSMETSLGILGYSLEDEKNKRIAENEAKLDSEIFLPHNSQYTNSGGDGSGTVGAPSSNKDEDKKNLDKDYTKKARK